jgi:hypothetical protein
LGGSSFDLSAYMLQHSSQLTREGWIYERNLLREFLVYNKTPGFIREENKEIVDSGKRKFNIGSKNGVPLFDTRACTKTIMDVNADEAEAYCRDVTAWAKAVLTDAESMRFGT